MQVSRVQYYKDLDFETYKSLNGLSYSGIKGGVFTPTAKMKLGTAVHEYLLEPSKYNHDNREVVKPIADAVSTLLGDALKFAQKEISITCVMEHNDMMLHYKGRIDIYLPNMIVDLKVSEMDLNKSIPHFGYDRQINGYMLATGAEKGLIVRVNPKTHKIQTKVIAKDTTWWESIIEIHGIPQVIFS